MTTQTTASPFEDRTQEMEGGARALALEPVAESASCGTLSRQTTLLAWRYGVAQAAGAGVLNDAAPVLKAQQIRQLASWVCCWPPSSPVAGEWLKQISAAASGSETADANAQLAPMGARICTISAITKTGTYRLSRCILKTRSGPLNTKLSASRDRPHQAWLALSPINRRLRRFIPKLTRLSTQARRHMASACRRSPSKAPQMPVAFLPMTGIAKPARARHADRAKTARSKNA